MADPITELEKSLSQLAIRLGIETDITKRWENNTPHHWKSEKLAREIAAMDWLYLNNFFDLKFGGDGDNGEFLMYLLDILAEIDESLN